MNVSGFLFLTIPAYIYFNVISKTFSHIKNRIRLFFLSQISTYLNSVISLKRVEMLLLDKDMFEPPIYSSEHLHFISTVVYTA